MTEQRCPNCDGPVTTARDDYNGIMARLGQFYSYNESYTWLVAQHQLLDKQRPIELILNGRRREVLAIIEQLESGAYL